MRRAVVGMLAHVDAGKTTLSEAMLYRAGQIRSLGRVDHGDSHLDTDSMERQRGITIFSSQAELVHGDLHLQLLDTPGHVDFSGETERAIGVMDYAVLVVNASDGVQGHTETLWHLLEGAGIPVFIFVNKMDLAHGSRDDALADLRERLSPACADFSRTDDPELLETCACTDEAAMEEYLESGTLSQGTLRRLIRSRKVFPCAFGSALKLEGVDDFLSLLDSLVETPARPEGFAARVFKVSRDEHGARLTWLKVTGGELAVKDQLEGFVTRKRINGLPLGTRWIEKVDQVRLYSGAKYRMESRAQAGQICAVTGLTQVFPGDVLGDEPSAAAPVLEPVLSYCVELRGNDAHKVLLALGELAEEDPLLDIAWHEQVQEIHLRLMGPVQLEVLQQRLLERHGMDVGFGAGSIMYKETIAAPVVGVGHFEPLRHYAEVHLMLEPLPAGTGMVFGSACDENALDRNWQRLILTNAMERDHLGVLVGAPLTDVRVTLLAGAAHPNHTQGGDFRQATYRAIRQGLMKAGTVLLEPWYRFRLEVPQEQVGRAITDLQRMCGVADAPLTRGDCAVLTGEAPVSEMGNYAAEVVSYTRGRGRLLCTPAGYKPCHNAEEVISRAAYEPEADLPNTPDSVFCAHGAGYPVKWDQVDGFAHLTHDERSRVPWREADAGFFAR